MLRGSVVGDGAARGEQLSDMVSPAHRKVDVAAYQSSAKESGQMLRTNDLQMFISFRFSSTFEAPLQTPTD